MTTRRGLGRLAGLLGLVLLLATGPSCTERTADTEPLPRVRLSTLDGESLLLGGPQGIPALVVFFAINNPLALTELDRLQTLAEQPGNEAVELVAIALSGERPELVRTIVHEKQYLFPVVMDPDGAAATVFGGITVTPTVLLLSRNGQVEVRQEGATDLRSLSARIQGL